VKFEIIDNCPVPARLAPVVREIKARTGATLNSCDRSPEAEPLLQRCNPAKMSQRQLFDGWQARRPGFNPANPPGRSTHERRNDGVAYAGPAGMPLMWWQVGMDWQNSDAVVRAAAALGYTATRTYPSNPLESHHLNFRKEPPVKVLPPLKRGSKGVRVARMTKTLSIVKDKDGAAYLARGQGIFDEKVEEALKRFQREWDQNPDGIYGPQTARQLAVALRAEKQSLESSERSARVQPPLLRSGSKGWPVARMAKLLATVKDAQGKTYLPKGQGIFDETVEAALKRFQTDNRLEADGVYGPATARALAEASKRQAG
jgi:murein L,D-transpeptidase YcbB/YkuD